MNEKNQNTEQKIEALEADNKRLLEENERLYQMTQSTAEANANATELMVELQELNDSLSQEINKRKQAEKDLGQYKCELEELVTIQTKELRESNQALKQEIEDRKFTQYRLNKLNQDLEKHNKMKSELVISITHELRTPLTIIRNIFSNMQVGAMGKLNKKQAQNLDIVMGEIDRLARIISDFFDISKLDIGKIKLKYEDLTVQKVVEGVVDTILPLAAKKFVELRMDMPDLEISFKADRDRIQQVLSNLLDNAIKYTPDCFGQVTVRVNDLGDTVAVEVEDNGRGIECENINIVFDRFVQIRKNVGPGYHGTGLGLAVCKDLVELHGGKIRVENVPDGGAKFTFTLPKCPMLLAEEKDFIDNEAAG